MSRIVLLGLGFYLLAIASTATANDFTFNGFGSLVVGSVVDGNKHDPLTYNPSVDCPCVVTDWSNNGFYEGSSPTLSEDSKIGVQMKYTFNEQFDATGQIVLRGTDTTPDISWLYLSTHFGDQWQLDIGRKRIPLYYYSDFQDLGLAFPWVTPPAELYGWETTNYNGASLRKQSTWGDVDANFSVFAGNESVNDNPYFLTFDVVAYDSEWNNIAGVDLEISSDWWTIRWNYIQADVETDYGDGFIEHQDMVSYGMAFNGDFESWFFRTEAGINDRDYTDYDSNVKSPSYSFGVGFNVGEKWVLFFNYAYYKEIAHNDPEYEYFRFGSTTFTTRYNLTPSSALKFQVDFHADDSVDYTGDATLVRVSYDFVF